jgi:phosphoribosylanthranilate isomerase
MAKPLIKICGLMDADTACQVSQMGVDFIGIVFHPASRRYVTIHQAKKIVAATKSGNAQPVAVFVNHSARQMAEIASATGIEYIQLHGPRARRQHYLLPEKYSRIYVQTVSPDGVIVIPNEFSISSLRAPAKQSSTERCSKHELDCFAGARNDEYLRHCNPARDFLLFDTLNPGHGQTFNWDSFQYNGHFRHGLAGGLTPTNVETAIKKIQPVLVDVSSGVENSTGDKDLDLIQQFINAVRGITRNSHYAE